MLSNQLRMFQLIVPLIVNLIYVDCAHDPVVTTRYGPIQGLSGFANLSGSCQSYEAFLGIPFADPPLGEKRFQPPIPFNSYWIEPYQATHFGNACVQKFSSVFNIDEDCLYLNIWRPVMTSEESDELIPVFYHIHGSGYTSSSGSVLKNRGEVIAASQRVIVVNSNYRLGVFGFAYGSSDNMPGNVGLYDALIALQWIQDNIRSFGGDPNRVTLTGLSAGSKMVSIISSIPDTRRFYSSLIMMSGSAVNQVHIESPEFGLLKTKLLASKVNCLDDKFITLSEQLSAETANCLQRVSADDLLIAQNSEEINSIGASEISPFLPVYGTELIPERAMINHINNLEANKNVPMLFGSEQDEASPFKSVESIMTIQDASNYIKDRVSFALKNITEDQFQFMFKMYFNNVDPADYLDIKSRCVNLISDMNYYCPSLILSELFSQISDEIYFYKNVHSAQKLTRTYGTQHGDDTMFGLGDPYRQPNSYTEADREFSSILMKVFGDFVKGIPLTNWPTIKLDKYDQSSLQLIREMSINPKNIVDHSQTSCMEWAKIFNYMIP